MRKQLEQKREWGQQKKKKREQQSGEADFDVFDGGTRNPEMQKKWSLKCLMDEILILSEFCELLPMQSTEVTAAIFNTLLGEKWVPLEKSKLSEHHSAKWSQRMCPE